MFHKSRIHDITRDMLRMNFVKTSIAYNTIPLYMHLREEYANIRKQYDKSLKESVPNLNLIYRCHGETSVIM